MDKLITVAIIGCGGRGSTYGRLMHERFEGKFKVVALCDISIDNLNQRGDEYGVAPENRFLDETKFLKRSAPTCWSSARRTETISAWRSRAWSWAATCWSKSR